MGLRNTLLVARRQIGTMREDRYVLLLLALVVALGVVSVLGARHHTASEAEQRARYQALGERRWAEQPDRHPYRVIHYGFLVLFSAAPFTQVDWDRVPTFEPAAPAGDAPQTGLPAAAALILISICAVLPRLRSRPSRDS